MCARLDMHFAADFTTCVGLISKAECRELRIVVIHHIPTHGALAVNIPPHAVILTAPQSLANDKIRVVVGSPGVFQVLSGVRKIGRAIL